MEYGIPHFYTYRKFIGIYPQDAPSGQRLYAYTGGKDVYGCSYQLNNINSVCGCILTLTHFLAKKAGINHRFFRQQPEPLEFSSGGDEGLKGLLDNNLQSLANIITTEAGRTNYRIKALEAQVAELKDLIETVQDSIDEINVKFG